MNIEEKLEQCAFSQEGVKKIISLSTEECIDLYKRLNFSTWKDITYMQLKALISYLKSIREDEKIKIDISNSKEILSCAKQSSVVEEKESLEDLLKKRKALKSQQFRKSVTPKKVQQESHEVIEHVQVELKQEKEEELKEEKPVLKEVKAPKKKEKKIPVKSTLKKVMDPKVVAPKTPHIEATKNFRVIVTQKEASKIYNQESMKLFYALTLELSIEKCIAFDLKKSFTKNLEAIQKEYKNRKIFFYTNNEKYDKKSSRTYETRKKLGRVFTEEEDKKILEYYNSDFYKSQKKDSFENPYTIKDLCAELKIDKKLAAKRASELGFTAFKRPKEKDWTMDEEKILKENVNSKTVPQIQKLLHAKGYTRSVVAINIKLKRMEYSLKLDGTGDLNITLLSQLMGVDTHFFLDDKDRMQKLNPGFESNQYVIKRNRLREYIINNPYDFNIGKVEPKFFIDLLSEVEAPLE